MIKEKASTRLFLCLFFVYTMNTFGKIAFSAVTAELVNEAVLTKTQAGIVSGVFWLVYAVGQFFGGSLATKYSSSLIVKVGIVGGAVANFLLAWANDFTSIFVIWSINGLLQFGVWPGILALMSTKIIPDQRNKSFKYISYCYAIGSILSHFCTAAVLSTLSWQYVFICCGIMNAVSLFPMLYADKTVLPYLGNGDVNKKKVDKVKLPDGFIWKSGLIFFCAIIFIKSFLETGIKSWMPTLLMESHGVTPEYTSILSVILLILNLFGVSIGAFIYRKAKENEVSTLLAMYLSIAPLMVMLFAYKSMPVLVATAVFSVITVLLYGSGQIVSMYYPSRFQSVGATAVMGGVINCFAALGNVVAAYGNGLVADLFGWDAIMYIWNGFIVLFVIIAVSVIPIWNKFRKNGI